MPRGNKNGRVAINKYYKFLFENFGYAECLGCLMLSKVLELYKLTEVVSMLAIYAKVAEQFNTTAWAVERNIRTYIKKILDDYTVDELSSALHYSFKAGATTLTASALVPAIKYYVDNN